MLLKNRTLTFLGLLLAFNVMILFLATTMESNTLMLSVGAACLIGIAVIESNVFWGVAFYIASVVLAFFIVPNKLDLTAYIIILAPYALIKEIIERKLYKVSRVYHLTLGNVLKLGVLNLLAILAYLIMKQTVTLPLKWWMIVAYQPLALVYDYFFGMVMHVYIHSIRPRLKR